MNISSLRPLTLLLAFYASFGAHATSAQVYTNALANGSTWTTDFSIGAPGTITIGGGRAQYTLSTAEETSLNIIYWNQQNFPRAQDWQFQIEAHIKSPTTFLKGNDRIELEAGIRWPTQFASHSFNASLILAGTFSQPIIPPGSDADVGLRLLYNASENSVSVFENGNGLSAEGWVYYGKEIAEDLVSSLANPFTIDLIFDAEGFSSGPAPTIPAGKVYFDNASISILPPNPVPEPSSFAALGAAVLIGLSGLKAKRRK